MPQVSAVLGALAVELLRQGGHFASHLATKTGCREPAAAPVASCPQAEPCQAEEVLEAISRLREQALRDLSSCSASLANSSRPVEACSPCKAPEPCEAPGVALAPPEQLAAASGLGFVVGAAVLSLFGRRPRRRPSRAADASLPGARRRGGGVVE